ncbi:MAG: YraN family protein [Gammaproteobacteria bacterium]|nr:YraN family protein [Gammaproteobacteria bacterium]
MRADPAPGAISRGQWAEAVARDFLQSKGLKLLASNYRCRHGELDLIMRDRTTIVFVEVRYRRSDGFGSAAESVTSNKQRRLIATARHYLQHTGPKEDPACRFDVLAIGENAGVPAVDWIKDAFDA